ncbi:UvrD-helicase domain-containing protein, partial [Candidatus Woesearchaeota archaeon]|nr:UvrD-helicase domain-containing protein [Candidatus Woesearchaeota archaeon]
MSFSFKQDGSLDAKPRKKRDHLPVLLALEEIPFGMGKKLLTQHLRGERNARTTKLRLDRYTTNGDLGGHEPEEIRRLLDYLETTSHVTIKREQGRYPVYTLTAKGQEELATPQLTLDLNKLEQQAEEALALTNPFTQPTTITDKEKTLFRALNDFFPDFNDEQRKAVTSPEQHILCVAGAGSGKTSVLTKRIAFLIKYKSAEPETILAITFTRKARREMQARLAQLLPYTPIRVETFNSFAEKILQRRGRQLYHDDVTMASFNEQFRLLQEVLKDHGYTQASIIEHYFTKRQRAGKNLKTLFFSFAYDFHTLLDKIRITNATTRQLRDN